MENKAIILGMFDLGYIVELDNGKKAELRAPNMKGEELDFHLRREERTLIGKVLDVNIIYQDLHSIQVSQFSRDEIREKERLYTLRQQANETCKIADRHTFIIKKITRWGAICEQDDGYIEAAIIGNINFKIGDTFIGKVVKKSDSGSPIIEISNENN